MNSAENTSIAVEGLYKKLKMAYTEKNLTQISAKLIDAYRNKSFTYLKSLISYFPDFTVAQQNNIHKIFSQFILLYHPDRLNYYKAEIESGFNRKDFAQLHKHAHIITILEGMTKKIGTTGPSSEEIRESMEEEYWYQEEEFDQVIDIDNEEQYSVDGFGNNGEDVAKYDFLTILNQAEGNPDLGINKSQLENLEGELDLSGLGINELDGIEYCRNLSSLNLSNNKISCIHNLAGITNLNELYLSENVIDSIEALSSLPKLKILDISFNRIEDISALMQLPALEFVNLTGNLVSIEQIDVLTAKNVLMIH